MVIEEKEYDVVCVGAGGAGIAAAVAAASCGARVAILSKEPVGLGNTGISGGIVARPGLTPGDGIEAFKQDLLSSGEQLNNPQIVNEVAEHASEAVELFEDFGVLFVRDEDGKISNKVVIQQGGHSFPRTVSTGASKGIAIANALRAVAVRTGIDVFEEFVVARLLTKEGRITGLVGFCLRTGEPLIIAAKAVVLATGGAPWIFYPHTDATRTTVGDGFALAYWAGAELIDMEAFQSSTEPGFSGPFARLTNARGEVVRDPVGLVTRAELTRIIAMELVKGNGTPGGGLIIDPRPNLESPEGLDAFQRMTNSGALESLVQPSYGAKAARWEEPWEMRPRSHFTLGGVRIDERGGTKVDGLFAAGEVTGGLHGANRLGTTALTEILVMGTKAGLQAANYSKKLSVGLGPSAEEEAARILSLFGRQGANRPVKLTRRLQNVMWEKVGLVRTEDQLQQALGELEEIAAESDDLRISDIRNYNTEVLDAVELQFMLTVGQAMTLSALQRRETRGANIRLDYPEKSDEAINVVVWQENGKMMVRRETSGSSDMGVGA